MALAAENVHRGGAEPARIPYVGSGRRGGMRFARAVAGFAADARLRGLKRLIRPFRDWSSGVALETTANSSVWIVGFV
jgi:hypothetical protein